VALTLPVESDGTRILLFGSPYASRGSSFQYLNTGAFALPPVASTAVGVIDPSAIPSRSMLGITGRDTYRAPRTNNWDMTLAKSIPIRERVQFQLRCEAYNVFNHPSYDAVQNTATFNATTGQLTSNSNFGALPANAALVSCSLSEKLASNVLAGARLDSSGSRAPGHLILCSEKDGSDGRQSHFQA